MKKDNVCQKCIGTDGNECCIDVYIILNPNEVHLFKEVPNGPYSRFKIIEKGGIYYTNQGCLYFKKNLCIIHQQKPLYCKYYPIFITGEIFIHKECSIHNNYRVTKLLKKKINKLQQTYPIYKKDWFWEEIIEELQLDPWIISQEKLV
ncbi:MAG: YkgJ family cysteine cluster protein [Promethearchaeota archaeon]